MVAFDFVVGGVDAFSLKEFDNALLEWVWLTLKERSKGRRFGRDLMMPLGSFSTYEVCLMRCTSGRRRWKISMKESRRSAIVHVLEFTVQPRQWSPKGSRGAPHVQVMCDDRGQSGRRSLRLMATW